MQAVILAGGLGTRLGPLSLTRPKALVPVRGRPFIDYQLDLLRAGGVDEIVLCVGHFGDQVRAHCGDGRLYGLSLAYSDDGETLLGTAAAVKKAEPLLAGQFFLTYGDAYLRLPYAAIVERFSRRAELGLMVVYRNDDRHERSNVVAKRGLVTAYDKNRRLDGMCFINFGVSILRREALALVPAQEPFSQEQWYELLIAQRQLRAQSTRLRPYEVGSPRGLRDFERFLAGPRYAAESVGATRMSR